MVIEPIILKSVVEYSSIGPTQHKFQLIHQFNQIFHARFLCFQKLMNTLRCGETHFLNNFKTFNLSEHSFLSTAYCCKVTVKNLKNIVFTIKTFIKKVNVNKFYTI